MLVKYATLWLFTLPLSPCNLLAPYPFWLFFSAFFFGVAQAFKMRFCSGIMLLFDVSASNYAPFWGSNMFQRGDYAREILIYMLLCGCSRSPFPLATSLCHVSFTVTSYFRLIYSGLTLAGDIAFFFYRVHNE